MLTQLNLENFTVFRKINLKFSPQLNVIIGENGTGKSHLLKLIYTNLSVLAEGRYKSNLPSPTKSFLQKEIGNKLNNVFRPDNIGRLVRRIQGGRTRCKVTLELEDKQLNCSFNFSGISKTDVLIDLLPKKWLEISPIFIPTRELLTIYPNFLSMYENHYLDFEETYRDTCILLGALPLKGLIEVKVNRFLRPLEEAMDGKVKLDKNGRFYLKSNTKGEIEMPLVAEGLRKLAMLAQLIATGNLFDQGYLFWDEPETNLNPALIKVVAKVIFRLAQSGIQVFIATHSLFLLRELEILTANNPDTDKSVRYFGLSSNNSDSLQVTQGNSISDIDPLVTLDEQIMQSDRFMSLEY
jgi:energy-coupling factor transporter ATP-binding protein EcfA2